MKELYIGFEQTGAAHGLVLPVTSIHTFFVQHKQQLECYSDFLGKPEEGLSTAWRLKTVAGLDKDMVQ